VTQLTPRVEIWKAVGSYLMWVASVRFRRHALPYIGTAAFVVGVAGLAYTLAMIAGVRATP
jgi:hypothetical protein